MAAFEAARRVEFAGDEQADYDMPSCDEDHNGSAGWIVPAHLRDSDAPAQVAKALAFGCRYRTPAASNH